MAANLCRAGVDLTVYNRSPGPRAALSALGAVAVDTPAALFARCDTIILMLADDVAIDFVLNRGKAGFDARVAGRLIVNMGTHAPSWSEALAADIRKGGGSFVEAPVSGSRQPAETGALVAMMAGDLHAIEQVRPLLAPLCREIIIAGAVPSAMAMKLAVNLYLIATVAALAEAANLARGLSVDLGLFEHAIASGSLRSEVAVAKLGKMRAGDFTPQASILDVCKNAALVARAAVDAGVVTPLLDEARERFDAVRDAGGGGSDMAAVFTTFTSREMPI